MKRKIETMLALLPAAALSVGGLVLTGCEDEVEPLERDTEIEGVLPPATTPAPVLRDDVNAVEGDLDAAGTELRDAVDTGGEFTGGGINQIPGERDGEVIE